ncbi:MAG: hypothetical protein IH946_07145 [Bacteroidetes bacterium]|nr:hypothetical protein [Bacteroidota bacterium]
MYDIEPFYNWRDLYTSEEDQRSPFYGKENSDFEFSNKIYNYVIHPQWDSFGSSTLYIKVLYTDYLKQFTIFELLGEWNDAISNDIMFLKKEVIDPMQVNGINKFMVIGENVLNFHGSDDCYYEEWYSDIISSGGWITLINFREHVLVEMNDYNINQHCNLQFAGEDVNWRKHEPKDILTILDKQLLT